MANDVNIRAYVLEALTEIDRDHKNASEVMQTALRNHQYLDKKERAFYSRLCHGTLEYRIQLDYLIDQVSKTPTAKCKPYIRNLLRMSLYQILYMDRVSDQTACNEAVKLAKKKGFQNLSGFVNGVLRNLIRQKETLSLPERPGILDETLEQEDRLPEVVTDLQARGDVIRYLSVTYSMPEYLVEAFAEWYPIRIMERVLSAFLQEMPTCIRVNLEKITTEELQKRLNEAGITSRSGVYCKNILRISEYNYLNRVPGYREGLFTVQDESSCLQGYLLPIQELIRKKGKEERIRILDLCASPGGKAMHAAERIHLADGSTEILARDISENKLARIRENLDRMGYSDIWPEVYDATNYDPALEHKIDLILADVPCSGLGVIGRKTDIKYHLQPEQLKQLVLLQQKILQNAVRYLAPNGYLIYSTCTLNPKENEKQVMWMEKELGLLPVSIADALPEVLCKEIADQPGTDLQGGYCTLLPGIQSCDGFFMARLQKADQI